MRFILIVCCCLLQVMGVAQNKFTINGYVRDSASGESIIGATVSVNGKSKSVTTNQYGYYSITLERGHYTITTSHVAYFSQQTSLLLFENQQLNYLLASKTAAMNEVVVYSRRKDANIRNAQMGKIDLSVNQIKSVPAFMGEVDILKTIQLLPGVRNAGEGNAGFYVRGVAQIRILFYWMMPLYIIQGTCSAFSPSLIRTQLKMYP